MVQYIKGVRVGPGIEENVGGGLYQVFGLLENLLLQKKSQDFQASQAEKSRDFQASQAEKSRQFQLDYRNNGLLLEERLRSDPDILNSQRARQTDDVIFQQRLQRIKQFAQEDPEFGRLSDQYIWNRSDMSDQDKIDFSEKLLNKRMHERKANQPAFERDGQVGNLFFVDPTSGAAIPFTGKAIEGGLPKGALLMNRHQDGSYREATDFQKDQQKDSLYYEEAFSGFLKGAAKKKTVRDPTDPRFTVDLTTTPEEQRAEAEQKFQAVFGMSYDRAVAPSRFEQSGQYGPPAYLSGQPPQQPPDNRANVGDLAEALATILSGIFGGQTARAQAQGPAPPALTPGDATTSPTLAAPQMRQSAAVLTSPDRLREVNRQFGYDTGEPPPPKTEAEIKALFDQAAKESERLFRENPRITEAEVEQIIRNKYPDLR